MVQMEFGPGKYDELCTRAREEAQAEGAVVAIFKGRCGTGFSVQGSLVVHEIVRRLLNATAAGMSGDFTSSARNLKYEKMRSLLDELRTARPLLLYGDAWVSRIEEVLEMPDDAPKQRPM